MKPHYDQKTNQSGGQVLRTMAYTIKSRNIRHIVKLIRDSIYKDKIMAILREYSTNGMDSHLRRDRLHKDGSAMVPITVTLPTLLEPFLKIRDCGVGLTPEEMENVYISIGESEARESDEDTGSMGLGSKSGFGYGDSFCVTSWKNGQKTQYNMVLDDTVESGCLCQVLIDEKCGKDEHGVEIEIPIREEDIKLFPEKALSLFKYWKVFPEIHNIDENQVKEAREEFNKPSVLTGNGWTIRPSERWEGGKTIVVMANVPYRVNLREIRDQIKFDKPQDRIIFDFLASNDVIFEVPNGTVEFDAGREGLQYTARTVETINKMVKEISDTIQTIVTDKISKASNLWEAKIIYGSIFDGSNWTRREQTDEDEKADTSGFNGELDDLKEFFKDKLVWNGIKINSSIFKNVQLWDFSKGKMEHSYDVRKTVLERFSTDGNRIRGRKCNGKKFNEIVPSRKAVILINDTGKNYGARMTAKYILTSGAIKGVVRVYFLNFESDEVKAEFFNHYHFDSVPVELVSTWLDKAKADNKANRVSGGNSGGRGSVGPMDVHTLEVKDYGNSYYSRPSWSVETVDVKEESGYFVARSTDRSDRNSITIEVNGEKKYMNIGTLASNLQVLKKHFGLDVEKIFGFTSRTLGAKWFDEAKSDGQWTPIGDFLAELPDYITDEMKEAFAWVQAMNDNDKYHHIGRKMARRLQGKIVDDNSPMNKLINVMVNIKTFSEIYNALRNLGFEVPTKKTVDFKALMKEVHESYPLLWELGCQYGLKDDGDDNYERLNKRQLELVVDHVNKEDMLRTLSIPVSVNQQTQPVEA